MLKAKKNELNHGQTLHTHTYTHTYIHTHTHIHNRKLRADTQSDKNRAESWPDFHVLCLLATCFNRAISLYVPWQDRPLRINPGLETKGPAFADPIAFVGMYQRKPLFMEITEDASDHNEENQTQTEAEDDDDDDADNSQGGRPNGEPQPEPMEEDDNGQKLPQSRGGGSSQNLQQSRVGGSASGLLGGGGGGGRGMPTTSPLLGSSNNGRVSPLIVDVPRLIEAGPQTYKHDVFALSDWRRKSVGDQAVFSNDRLKFSVLEDNFRDIRSNFAQFSERFMYVRCEQGKQV
jgi:hypothetical protein